MKQKIYSGILITLLCIFIQGCGKFVNKTSDNNSFSNLESDSSNTTIPPSNSTETLDNEKKAVQEYPSIEPTSSIEKHIEELSLTQNYSDAYRMVTVLGLKEYKKLKSNNYTDKAKKGKKFLVLFLSVRNDSSEDDYINYNYISAKVDGKKVEHTFLVNEPKGYPTIFTQIPAGKSIGGFIVWEVPSDWKKLEFTYNGWQDINNVSMESKFTPYDLSDPVIYNANDFK